jgi:hypothetical protein
MKKINVSAFINRANLQQFADDAIENIRERFSKLPLNEEEAEIVDILDYILPDLICDNTLIAKRDEKNDTIEIDFYEQNFNIAISECFNAVNDIADIRMEADGKERTKDQKEKIIKDNREDLEQSIRTLFYLDHFFSNIINFLDLPIFKPLDASEV